MSIQTIKLPKTDLKRLQHAAVSFGIPTEEIIIQILSSVAKSLTSIPEESLDDYDNKKEILYDLQDALRAEKQGKLIKA